MTLRILSAVFALLLVAAPALGAEFVWLTETTNATRFVESDSDVVGNVEAGERLEVVFREGDRLRVKLPGSSKFGWVDSSRTSDTDPSASSPEEPADPEAP